MYFNPLHSYLYVTLCILATYKCKYKKEKKQIRKKLSSHHVFKNYTREEKSSSCSTYQKYKIRCTYYALLYKNADTILKKLCRSTNVFFLLRMSNTFVFQQKYELF